MCSGPRKPSTPSPEAMDVDYQKLSYVSADASLLLELSASDELVGFKRAVEENGHEIDAAALWYGRSLGTPRRMGFELRTPLMIAAAYGSTAVLNYILLSKAVDINHRCGSDGATALHCAAAGGAPETARMLVDASADIDGLDAAGNRPADVIAKHPSSSITKSLEVILKASCSRASSPSSPSKGEESPTKQGEKKEYPPDVTLPDIKNGIYGTDEFRMYAFKIKPCSRAYSHDWTECPFVHPGENARRRDPRKYLYSCVPCPEFRKGSCRNGDACEYAHGVFECWLHPAQYRTRLCKDEAGCNRRVCFFAHKPEELRSVNPSAVSTSGLGISSPRSPSIGGVSSLDMAAAMLMMQTSSGSGSGSPMSPKASSAMGASAVWMSQPSSVMTPTSQLPSSRLKSTLSARDLDLGFDLLGLEGYQQKLINEIAAASPRSQWTTNTLASRNSGSSRASDYSDLFGSLDASMLTQLQPTATRTSDYSDLLGSLDTSVLSQLHGLSLKQVGGAATGGAQFQSPIGVQVRPSLGQQVLSGYGSNLTPSSPVSASSSIEVDQSLAKAIMNSRASAFAKRSQSFCDRGAVARRPSLPSATTPVTSPSGLSDWGSPNGKLDWGIEGEELNKLRKAASFNYRSNSSGLALMTASPAALDEPDLSWVQSLVKDGPGPVDRLGHEQQQKQQMFAEQEMLPAWAEQMYIEQEQMVA